MEKIKISLMFTYVVGIGPNIVAIFCTLFLHAHATIHTYGELIAAVLISVFFGFVWPVFWLMYLFHMLCEMPIKW